MGKYDPLRRFLKKAAPQAFEIMLSFSQIEQILVDKLPNAARQPGWWANGVRSNAGRQSSSWLAAGWEVDTANTREKWVRFRRSGEARRGLFGATTRPLWISVFLTMVIFVIVFFASGELVGAILAGAIAGFVIFVPLVVIDWRFGRRKRH